MRVVTRNSLFCYYGLNLHWNAKKTNSLISEQLNSTCGSHLVLKPGQHLTFIHLFKNLVNPTSNIIKSVWSGASMSLRKRKMIVNYFPSPFLVYAYSYIIWDAKSWSSLWFSCPSPLVSMESNRRRICRVSLELILSRRLLQQVCECEQTTLSELKNWLTFSLLLWAEHVSYFEICLLMPVLVAEPSSVFAACESEALRSRRDFVFLSNCMWLDKEGQKRFSE